MAEENLPGTYKTGTPGMTTRAQELLNEYKNSRKEGTYELTTAESQEIREAIQTAGSVRKELMQMEGVTTYRQLSPQAREILGKAYSEASEKIKEIANKKVEEIRDGHKNKKIEWTSAADSAYKLGEKLAGIIEVAKNDFGVPNMEKDANSSYSTIERPIQKISSDMDYEERTVRKDFYDSYENKSYRIRDELWKKENKREKKGIEGVRKDIEAEAKEESK